MFLKTRKTTLQNANFLAKKQTRHLYLTDLTDMLFLQNAKRDISVFLKWGCTRCSQAVTLEGEADKGETSQCISMEALTRDLQKGSVHYSCKCAKTKTNNASLYIKSYSALLLLRQKSA